MNMSGMSFHNEKKEKVHSIGNMNDQTGPRETAIINPLRRP